MTEKATIPEATVEPEGVSVTQCTIVEVTLRGGPLWWRRLQCWLGRHAPERSAEAAPQADGSLEWVYTKVCVDCDLPLPVLADDEAALDGFRDSVENGF